MVIDVRHLTSTKTNAPLESPMVLINERSGAEHVEDTFGLEDEVEVKSVYVRNFPSNAIAEEFKKFGKIRQVGVAIRTRKDIDVFYVFVKFQDITSVHNVIKVNNMTRMQKVELPLLMLWYIHMRSNLKIVDNFGAKWVMCIHALKGKNGAKIEGH